MCVCVCVHVRVWVFLANIVWTIIIKHTFVWEPKLHLMKFPTCPQMFSFLWRVCVCVRGVYLVYIVRTIIIIIKHTFCLRTEIASDEISNMSPDVQLFVTCVCVFVCLFSVYCEDNHHHHHKTHLLSEDWNCNWWNFQHVLRCSAFYDVCVCTLWRCVLGCVLM